MTGIFENLKGQLILASSSPRRRELLSHLGFPFQVAVPAIEELQQPGESARAYVARNAREKACAVLLQASSPDSSFVVGSDTIGVIDDEVLEKPIDGPDAVRMLRAMSGRRHEVLTGLAVASGSPKNLRIEQAVVSTMVLFKQLTDAEINYYVATGEAMDKAGAYGIQGIGGFMVEAIEGSYSNVVGLPLVEVADLLRRFQTPS